MEYVVYPVRYSAFQRRLEARGEGLEGDVVGVA